MTTLVIPTEAPSVPGPRQGCWTYADWETLPEDGNRYEIIDGALYMTTAPSFFHQWIVQGLDLQLGGPARRQNLAFCVPAPVGVLMPGCEPVQPDYVVVVTARRDVIHDRRIWGVPDLLVEILSPSSASYDKEVKFTAYAEAGVPEYVIVDPATRTLAYYRLEQPGHYAEPRVVSEGETVTFDCLPALPLSVSELFAGAPDTTL